VWVGVGGWVRSRWGSGVLAAPLANDKPKKSRYL